MTQLEYLEKAVRLKKENLDMEIRVLVHPDETEADYSWTVQQIQGVNIEYWYSYDEELFIDEGLILDHLENYLCLENSEVDRIWEEEVKQVIVIRTGAT